MKSPFLICLVLALLAGCGSPYREKGFKSEPDYELARAGGLSPRGVDLFKSVGVSTPEAFKEAAGEMKSSGYSSSSHPDAVYQYSKDRFDGRPSGRSALQQRTVRQEEERRAEQRKREQQQLEAQRKAAQEEAERKKKQQEEAAREAQRQKNLQALAAEWDRLDRVGPAFCGAVSNVSRGVAERVASGVRTDPSGVRFNRSNYVSPRQTMQESGLFGMMLGSMFAGSYDGSRLSPSCRVTLYTSVGPVYCEVEAAHIQSGVVVDYKSCKR